MAKVYPETITRPIDVSSEWHKKTPESSASSKNEIVLTVWKKSLLFNCDGFTVFDSNGNLVFRVDNYVARGNGEIILMDASGRSLQTIRHKMLSHNWQVYDQETVVKPLLSVKKHVNILNTKSLAYVMNDRINGHNRKNIYEIEGSYTQKCGVVYDKMQRIVAEIRPKEGKGGVSLGGDVFSLVVHPLIDPITAMSLVIVLDQMFRSSRR